MPTTPRKIFAVAFAGESQANRKYLAFSRQAEKEGFCRIARLFRAASRSRPRPSTPSATSPTWAASGPPSRTWKRPSPVGTHNFAEMYPPMVAHAEAEGHRCHRVMLGSATRPNRSTPASSSRRSTPFGPARTSGK